ncbi:hypothetical protein QN277_022130 [Acacia crassicarpa]|uniref:Dof zinc finger protein n=1 Tax=Acacia crassicarpa TaxID=499986 RepID=A0AAE1JIG6_9FABA|nr:hypothetical protein QN277_022130 [Acacia crassicarpa]
MDGLPNNQNSVTKPPVMEEKKARPQEQLNCPRCNSTNTKFCYYNNYSLTQPRYFCKTCRRYWTEGGSLRNIPVGGGSRKNKNKIITSFSASSSSSSSSTSSSSKLPDLNPPLLPSLSGFKDPSLNLSRSFPISNQQNPKIHGGQDLNLAFPTSSSSLSAPRVLNSNNNIPYVPSFMMMPNTSYGGNLNNYPSGLIPMHEETKPSHNNMGFSVDGLGNRSYGVQENDHNNGGRLLLPFGGVKQIPGGGDEVVVQNNKEQGNSSGFWTGMIGEGSW